MGCDDVIRKPFREHDIFAVIANYIDVRYRYAEEEPDPTHTAAHADTHHERHEIDTATLATLPTELVAKLYRMAILGDIDTLMRLVEQVRTHNEHIAKTLDVLINNFQFDRIVALLTPLAENSESNSHHTAAQ